MNTIKFDSKHVKMVAHRGLSGIERENTCPAFVAAGNRSYFGIETDVHVTKDKKFVIIHDETTNRVSGDKYQIDVENSDYSEIKDVVLPDKDDTTIRQDIRIPLLEEYIKICQKYDKICVLEAKNHFQEDDLEKMIEEIEKTGYLENVIFISFDLENCINIRKLLPQNDVQWLVREQVDSEMINFMRENKIDIDIYYHSLTAEYVQTLHSNGLKVNCWTCDTKENAERLVEYGVDFITTNILE